MLCSIACCVVFPGQDATNFDQVSVLYSSVDLMHTLEAMVEHQIALLQTHERTNITLNKRLQLYEKTEHAMAAGGAAAAASSSSSAAGLTPPLPSSSHAKRKKGSSASSSAAAAASAAAVSVSSDPTDAELKELEQILLKEGQDMFNRRRQRSGHQQHTTTDEQQEQTQKQTQ